MCNKLQLLNKIYQNIVIVFVDIIYCLYHMNYPFFLPINYLIILISPRQFITKITHFRTCSDYLYKLWTCLQNYFYSWSQNYRVSSVCHFDIWYLLLHSRLLLTNMDSTIIQQRLFSFIIFTNITFFWPAYMYRIN